MDDKYCSPDSAPKDGTIFLGTFEEIGEELVYWAEDRY